MSSQTWYVSGIWILRVMANFVKFMILEFVIENWAYLLHVTAVFGQGILPLYSATGNYTITTVLLAKIHQSSWLPCQTSIWNS